ncbi:MAG TPA: formimidoylglutamase [Acidobacteriota bacterium]|nr:formimidoylglutamase [Acidobacteriota bacterium]
MRLLPPEFPWSPAAADDPRLGDLVGRGLLDPGWPATPRYWELQDPLADPPDLAVIGFPCDLGVRRNSGRAGAAEGPDEIRRAFYRMTPPARRAAEFRRLLNRSLDFGNLRGDAGLKELQEALGAWVGRFLKAGATVVVLGGGHETAYGHFLGYVDAETPVTILNFDAHPDVRPLLKGKGHSGSPFRQALKHPAQLCTHYRVAGLQPHSTSEAHLDYIRQKGGDYYFREQVTPSSVSELFEMDGSAMASFDLDGLDQSWAPGVSAPSVGGLDQEVWLELAFQAGLRKAVRSIDIVELNPRVDPDCRTARVAALTLYRFLEGRSRRQ